ncbi:MAG: hypothetical protein A3K19_04340 [Lentisphaerae bacterium RIFOXYB12_FULL_65_16]|nr:MAG: hypothetical protein A3K18_34810 [Lentisphaerae bacterium RIFOXYA12_64_32]OGV84550.1 MAG: hypothetical protein A3K19_04340 [Lentisphaerae bacterium RIFOXYB12_FULL_65_16]
MTPTSPSICAFSLRDLPANALLLVVVMATAGMPNISTADTDRTRAALIFEPQDWTEPKDAWLVNQSTPDKWNLWSSDKDAEKRWTTGVVLQGPAVEKDRNSPEEGAPPLYTRITGIPEGCYDVSIKVARALGVSLDGKTWRRYTGGPLAENLRITDGTFEVWVDDRYASTPPGPCYYDQVILQPRRQTRKDIANSRFESVDQGQPVDWDVKGHLTYDAGNRFARLASDPRQTLLLPEKYDGISLSQTLVLKPGHYLLKATARANTMECILFARSLDYRGIGDRCQVLTGPFGVPIGVSPELASVELPFFVEDENGAEREVTVGITNQYAVPVHLEVDIREMTLERLGDTELTYHWAEKLQMTPHHGLTTLRDNTQWERPDRVIFTDTYTGAEVWLMTQGEKSYLRAQGVHSFSPNGKYLYIKDPGVIVRTDGSARYEGFKGYPTCEPWLAPWLQRRLPKDTDPADWVLATRPDMVKINLKHVVTGQMVEVPLPTREGWTLKLLPGKVSGISLQQVTHDTLVWMSDDQRKIGLSDSTGARFRAFDLKTVSDDPAKDVLLWRDQVSWLFGFDGRCYVGYILNWVPFMNGYDRSPENTVNPGQMWALPIAEDDTRGILQIVDGYQYWGMCMHPYKLTDGSLLHWWTATHRAMNGQAGFRIRGNGYSTLALEDAGTAQIRHFVGSYPCLDHIDFSHSDFVIPESLLYPYVLLFIDVKRRAMWPISCLQFRDYGPYTAGGGAGLQAQNPSPDVTKVACVSSMLCRTGIDGTPWDGNQVIAGKRPKTALDVYNVVVRYPQPPANVRLHGTSVEWEKPLYHKEIRGYNLYRAENSGVGFAKVNDRLIEGLAYPLPGDAKTGFVVLTSVEHSGLESRMFSEELAVGQGNAPFRHFYEAECAELAQPMAPLFDTPGCSNAYAVAVQDRDLLYKARLAAGLAGTGSLAVRIPAAGSCRILTRVRALKPGRSGRIEFKVNQAAVGGVTVDTSEWRWLPLDGAPPNLEAGTTQVTFGSSDAGIALDSVCLTNDPAFTPAGKGNTPSVPPSAPSGLRILPLTAADDDVAPKTKPGDPPCIKLVWSPVSAPQGVHHYSVYRSIGPGFVVGPETLLGSPAIPVFYDCGLESRVYQYRVATVDAWGNESAASETFACEPPPPSVMAKADVRLPGIGHGDEVVFDATPSTATKGNIAAYRWDFGDGTQAEGKTVRHAYPKGGRYTATLTVVGDTGERSVLQTPAFVHPPQVRDLTEDRVIPVEAETLAAEGGGTSQRLEGRMNASGSVVSYWEKDKGHWLEWEVPVTTAGTYTVLLKYCSGSEQALRDLKLDGEFPNDACRQLQFPGTHGFSSDADNWVYRTVDDAAGGPLHLFLTAGTHRLRMTNLGGGMGLDFILFVRQP